MFFSSSRRQIARITARRNLSSTLSTTILLTTETTTKSRILSSFPSLLSFEKRMRFDVRSSSFHQNHRPNLCLRRQYSSDLPSSFQEITMPALSPTMTKGGVTSWLVSEGQKVSAGDVLAEIQTDKATMEMESMETDSWRKF